MNESSNMQLHPEQDSFSLLTLEEKKRLSLFLDASDA